MALAAEDVAASTAAAARRVRKRLGYLTLSPGASPPLHTLAFAAAIPGPTLAPAAVAAAMPSPQAVAAATAPETAAATVLPPVAAVAPLCHLSSSVNVPIVVPYADVNPDLTKHRLNKISTVKGACQGFHNDWNCTH